MQETYWPKKIARVCALTFWWGFFAPVLLWPLRFWHQQLGLFRRNPRAHALFLPCFFVMGCTLTAGFVEDFPTWDASGALERMPSLRLNFAATVVMALQRPLTWVLAWTHYLLGAPAHLAASYALWIAVRWCVFAPFYYGAALLLANMSEDEPARAWLRKLGNQFGPEGVSEH